MQQFFQTAPLTGFPDPAPRSYEARHAALARRAAAEGMVLLKNEGNALPLAPGCRVALYGMGALHTVKGGTGSGDVNARASVSICSGLRAASLTIANEAWLERCEAIYAKARAGWRALIWNKLETKQQPHFFASYVNTPFEMPPCPPPEFCECDAVFYVLSRTAGEGADRRLRPGDYLLCAAERRDLEQLCALYSSVILVLNTGGILDLSFLDEMPRIRAVLLLSQPGMEGGHAFADVVLGKVSPCGRLTDTWPLLPQDHICMRPENRSAVCAGAVPYREGIYVGYRYFDTFGVPVRYGFGHGLSYTEFTVETQNLSLCPSPQASAELTVTVRNTGARYSARQVVQVYATCPLGGLHKEARRLVCYGKTRTLAPQSAQSLTLRFPLERLASYDAAAGGKTLCAGNYHFWVGASLAGARHIGALSLCQPVLVEKLDRLWPEFDDVDTLFPSAERCAAWRQSLDEALLARALPVVRVDPCAFSKTPKAPHAEPGPGALQRAGAIAAALSDEQLIRLCVGQWSRETESQLGAAGVSVPGSAGETSAAAGDAGVPPMVLADGPAGLRLNKVYFEKNGAPIIAPLEQCFEGGYLALSEYDPGGTRRYQYCTAFPIGTLLAQTWDTALLGEVGRAVGREMELFRVSLWLAPGMNIHRDPLCGRNFEYFSEDPLLSGLTAAAVAGGVQSCPGRGVTIKHFACNNQEQLRTESNSIVSERALREIYLRGFEIAVKAAQPMAIMTGYNLVNGVHAANSRALCTHIAREEWRFSGLFMTDWDSTSSLRCTPEGCILAGNDLMMPGSRRECAALASALESGALPRAALRRCAANVICAALCSGAAPGGSPDAHDPAGQ